MRAGRPPPDGPTKIEFEPFPVWELLKELLGHDTSVKWTNFRVLVVIIGRGSLEVRHLARNVQFSILGSEPNMLCFAL